MLHPFQNFFRGDKTLSQLNMREDLWKITTEEHKMIRILDRHKLKEPFIYGFLSTCNVHAC